MENITPPFKCIKHYYTKSIVIFYVYFITMLTILFRYFSREHNEYDALFRPINRNSRKSWYFKGTKFLDLQRCDKTFSLPRAHDRELKTFASSVGGKTKKTEID